MKPDPEFMKLCWQEYKAGHYQTVDEIIQELKERLRMNIWINVKADKLSIDEAIQTLTKLGATNTQTYRRIVRLKAKAKTK